ncbi:MAG: chorismate synthase [Lactobacillus porci]|nr:chorismate synthase [Lactobacillus porci]MDD6720465.1 chorismate synthase [Lactobacillus porci]
MHYITAGESHGPQLTAIIEGLPSGLEIDLEEVNQALAKRQGGYGRGGRQQIERDTVEIVGGVRHCKTLGGPIALVVKNRDHGNWGEIMSPTAPETEENSQRSLERPRPGHADLVGGMKYRHRDLRNVLERSSARETTLRVALGNICEQFLRALGIDIVGYVARVGSVEADEARPTKVKEIQAAIAENDLRLVDQSKVAAIHQLIDEAKEKGDTLGGHIRVVVNGVPAGLGSYISWDTKLDAKLAAAAVGVNAMKGVSFGDGFALGTKFGSQVMDEIDWSEARGWTRTSNHLGGFEGGMTNGMPIIMNVAMKPIPTLHQPLQSVDINSKERSKAGYERSDVTSIAAASLIVENVLAIELSKAICDQFESDNLQRLQEELAAWRKEWREY